MLLTTTSTLQGKEITQYLGIVSSEVIIGANAFKDIAASFTDFFGGRSTTYENTLKQAKDAVMQELIKDATAVGANAVIGIDLDYETVGSSGSMLMVTACGTAVKII
ncbi:MAG: YbjQ family protein [Bacteroidales bacterium]